MRADALRLRDDTIAPVERDLAYLLSSWFNRGFLELRAIDWQTPAETLEKLIEYEAVHEIRAGTISAGDSSTTAVATASSIRACRPNP